MAGEWTAKFPWRGSWTPSGRRWQRPLRADLPADAVSGLAAAWVHRRPPVLSSARACRGNRVRGQAFIALQQGGRLLEDSWPQQPEYQRVDNAKRDQAECQPGQDVVRTGLARPQVSPHRAAQHGYANHWHHDPQPGILMDAARPEFRPLDDERYVGHEVHDDQP